jgi:hypothetical protein
VALATAIKTVVKHMVVRTRPHVLADQGRYETGWLGPTDGPHSSFPSGHTADAIAAARALARVFPEAGLPAYAAAAAVAAIQIPRCAHYPSDGTGKLRLSERSSRPGSAVATGSLRPEATQTPYADEALLRGTRCFL